MRNVFYWIASIASLGLLAYEGPRAELLTQTPARAQITRDAAGKTVRGGAPLFIWGGGGYHGGK